jgi:hypothetical protein
LIGQTYLREKKRDQALTEFMRVVAEGGADPNLKATSQMNIAGIYLDRQEYGQARQAYQQVLQWEQAPAPLKAEAQGKLEGLAQLEKQSKNG